MTDEDSRAERFSLALRRARTALKMADGKPPSFEWVAQRLNITRAAVSEWEAGHRLPEVISTAVRLETVLHAPRGSLVEPYLRGKGLLVLGVATPEQVAAGTVLALEWSGLDAEGLAEMRTWLTARGALG